MTKPDRERWDRFQERMRTRPLTDYGAISKQIWDFSGKLEMILIVRPDFGPNESQAIDQAIDSLIHAVRVLENYPYEKEIK